MILTPDKIKNPVGGLIIEDEEEDNPILGAVTQDLGSYYASKIGEIPDALFPDKDSSKFVENIDLQRNGNFDAYDCVTCAHQGMIDVLEKAQWNELPKQSRRFTAVMSGTKPGVGNSNTRVQKSIINDGMVAEIDCVSMTPNMTQNLFYAPIQASVLTKEDFKNKYDIGFYLVPTRDGRSATRQDLVTTLMFSPIVVSVCGNYAYDAQGRVIRTSDGDSHDVYIVKAMDDGTWLIVDSENPNGFVPFAPNYDFHWPTFGYLKKKIMYQLVKEDGSPAIYVHCVPSGNLYAIADGDEIPGGDLLKTMSGTYGNAGIKHVAKLSDLGVVQIVGDVKTNKFNK